MYFKGAGLLDILGLDEFRQHSGAHLLRGIRQHTRHKTASLSMHAHVPALDALGSKRTQRCQILSLSLSLSLSLCVCDSVDVVLVKSVII